MSKDFQLAHACPHLVMEEVVAIGTDRRTLRTRSPVASANAVRVLANDTYIPSAGLYSQATLVSSTAGPYRVPRCSASLTVTGSAETATLTLPIGERVSTESIVAALKKVLSNVSVSVSNGCILLVDTGSFGTTSLLRVTGNAASYIGFGQQMGAQGKTVYPAWNIPGGEDPLVAGAKTRCPVFTSVIRQNPVFKVTYVTTPSRCLRCGATFIENDYQYDVRGEAILISGTNLLYQAALKIILTQRGSNPFHPYYGSPLTTRLGLKAIGATATLLTEDVQNALSTMMNLQGAQAKFQRVTAEERLYAVRSVSTTPLGQDRTAYRVDVVVSNASNKPVSISIVFSVPGVTALAGSNGLALGLESVGLTEDESRNLFR